MYLASFFSATERRFEFSGKHKLSFRLNISPIGIGQATNGHNDPRLGNGGEQHSDRRWFGEAGSFPIL